MVVLLVRARLTHRRQATALVALAVAASIVVLGALLGVGTIAADLATRSALAELSGADRAIGVHQLVDDAGTEAASDPRVRVAIAELGDLGGPILRATVLRPPRVAARVVGIDGIDRWFDLTSGRFPAACPNTGDCEVLRVGTRVFDSGVGRLGSAIVIGERTFTIVGVATPVPNLPIDVGDPNVLQLAVEGQAGLASATSTETVPRIGYWISELDPGRIHAWTLEALDTRLAALRRDLGGDRSFLVTAPERALESVRDRADVAIGRIVFISSLVLGVLLAFAAFAASVERADVALEARRLRIAGARRVERTLFLALEAGIPAALGLAIGIAAAVAVVGSLAVVTDEPAVEVIVRSLGAPGSIGLMLGVALLSAAAVFVGMHPAAATWAQPRRIALTALPLAAVLAWDQASRGSLGAADLAQRSLAPTALLLPGLLGLAVILGSLVLLPPVLRTIARWSRRAPVPLRMAAVSLARDPLRPAATLTLLAFSLGAAVLGITYSATLRAGAADEAAFRTGLDVRVQSFTAEGRFVTEVLPRLEGGILGPDVDVHPIVRSEAESASGIPLLLTGLEPGILADFRRWRDDYADGTPGALAAAIEMPGPWELPGHILPPGVPELEVDVESSGDPIRLDAIIERSDGTYDRLELGELAGGPQAFHVPLGTPDELAAFGPGAPIGWRIVGLLAINGGPSAFGGPNPGAAQTAELRVRNLPEIADPGAVLPIRAAELRSPQLIRASVRTDGLVLSALVSPALAEDVDGSGELAITTASGLALRLRPVGVVHHFPTQLDAGAAIAVVDEGPLRLAMTAREPGSGVPNQVLLAAQDGDAAARAVATLSADPFPPLAIEDRRAIEADLAGDPFAMGIAWALAVGAVAGVLLSLAGVLLGTTAELGDDTGELRDLALLGVRPSGLRRLIALRATLLAAAGAVAGTLIGIGLGWVTSVVVAVGGAGTEPLPPLVLVTPPGPILLLLAGIPALVAGAVWSLARARLRDESPR